jgi:tellurite resistance protein
MTKLMEQVEILRAACCVAAADGEISERERENLTEMANHIGVGTASLKAMMDLALGDKKFHEAQLKMLHKDPREAFATLYRVARLEREVPQDEREVLIQFGRRLGLESDDMNEVIQSVHGKAKSEG